MLGLMMIYIEIAKDNPWVYLSIFLFVPVSQFLVTPLFRLIGLYNYLSPMLLVYSPNPKSYDIHNGTSFDYLFVMKGVSPGADWKNKMLVYYMEGLLEIIRRIEEKELPDTVVIKGSSYFFSERTVERIGFELYKTNPFVVINIILNYLDLLWMYSLAHEKLRFPGLGQIKAARISGEDLVKSKPTIERIHKYLTKT